MHRVGDSLKCRLGRIDMHRVGDSLKCRLGRIDLLLVGERNTIRDIQILAGALYLLCTHPHCSVKVNSFELW